MKKDWEQSACLSYFSIAVIKHYAKVTYVFNFKLKYLIWLVVSEGLESMMAEQRNLRTHIYTAMRKRECALGSTVFWTLKACPNNDTAPPTRPHFFFSSSLKNWFFVNFTSHTSIPLISALNPCSLSHEKETKNKNRERGLGEETKTENQSHQSCSVSWWHTGYPFVQAAVLALLIAMTHYSGSRPMASATPSTLVSYWDCSYCCPVSWRSFSFGSSGPACILAVHRCVCGRCVCGVCVCWGGCTNSKPWIWAWVEAELVSPPALLHPHPQGKLSCAKVAHQG